MRIPRSAPLVLFGVLMAGALTADVIALAVGGEAEDEPLTLILFASKQPVSSSLSGPAGRQAFTDGNTGIAVRSSLVATGASGETLRPGATAPPASG